MRQNKYEYDAFISHAVEDKIPIANELCARLEKAGLKIWYSGKELGVGDSIEKTIEKGLNRSRYGIVIFSPTYLAKNWTIREFYTLLAKEIEEHKVILPVLYNITLDELKNKDLLMADRFAVNADRGLDFVVDRLVTEIRKPDSVKTKVSWYSRIWLLLILSLLTNLAFLLKGSPFLKSHQALVPAESSSEADYVPVFAGQEYFIGEIEGLFRQLSACTCDHRRANGQRPAYRTAPVVTSTPGNFTRTPYDGENQRRSRGRKMTMAVVFQIEGDPQNEQHMEAGIDHLMETVSLQEDKDPFQEVSNRNGHGRELKTACLQAASLGH